jgi:NADPH:quinone reductase-like Zn-dependent oxidoreductase
MSAPAAVLITGASKGIGLALTQLYISKGYAVYACVRKASETLVSARPAAIIEGVDFTGDDATSRVTSALGDTKLDIVVNNAVSFLWAVVPNKVDVSVDLPTCFGRSLSVPTCWAFGRSRTALDWFLRLPGVIGCCSSRLNGSLGCGVFVCSLVGSLCQ